MYDNNISTFICVSECGSLLKAAEKLYLSPNAVKKRIDRLEESIGACLFSRSAKGMTLTPAGKSFYFDCKRLEEEMNLALERARNIELKENGVIHLGMMDTFSDEFILSDWFNARNIEIKESGIIRLGMMDTFSDEFILSSWFDAREKLKENKISLAFYGLQPGNISEMLAGIGKSIDGAVDIADEKLAKKYGIEVTKISETKLCFAIPPAHPLFGKDGITAKDFAGEKIIVLQKGRIPLWDSLMESAFSEYPQLKPEYTDTCGVKTFNYAETERKIIITTTYAKNLYPYFRYVPIGEKYIVPFGIYHSEKPPEAIESFLNVLKR